MNLRSEKSAAAQTVREEPEAARYRAARFNYPELKSKAHKHYITKNL